MVESLVSWGRTVKRWRKGNLVRCGYLGLDSSLFLFFRNRSLLLLLLPLASHVSCPLLLLFVAGRVPNRDDRRRSKHDSTSLSWVGDGTNALPYHSGGGGGWRGSVVGGPLVGNHLNLTSWPLLEACGGRREHCQVQWLRLVHHNWWALILGRCRRLWERGNVLGSWWEVGPDCERQRL